MREIFEMGAGAATRGEEVLTVVQSGGGGGFKIARNLRKIGTVSESLIAQPEVIWTNGDDILRPLLLQRLWLFTWLYYNIRTEILDNQTLLFARFVLYEPPGSLRVGF
jgi:hypothetical protein